MCFCNTILSVRQFIFSRDLARIVILHDMSTEAMIATPGGIVCEVCAVCGKTKLKFSFVKFARISPAETRAISLQLTLSRDTFTLSWSGLRSVSKTSRVTLQPLLA